MKFIANSKTYELDETKITFAEGRAMEKVTGLPFMEVGSSAAAGSMLAMQALVWVTVKRSEPTTKFEDIDDWEIGAIEFQIEDEENPTEAAG